MTLESIRDLLFQLVTDGIRLFADRPPPAPSIYPSFFIFLFFIPTYLTLMGIRSALVDFRGWLLPRTAGRLSGSLNRIATLLLAGFLPGWLTTLAVYLWIPRYGTNEGLMAGFAAVFAFAVVYNFLLVRNLPGLSDALGQAYWHAVPIGGFFLCLYVGLFLYSGEALLLAFSFLFSPLGAALILPFAAAPATLERPEGSAEVSCTLCSEFVELAPIACGRCDAAYHAACWDYSEGCARRACRSDGAAPAARG